MTKEEIKALVAAKIAGQGSAIDAASVLPAIINAIIDLPAPAPDPQDIADAVTIRFQKMPYESASGLSKGQACAAFGISGDELDLLIAGKYLRYFDMESGEGNIFTMFGGDSVYWGASNSIYYDSDSGTYTIDVD